MPERHFGGNNNEVSWSHSIIEDEHTPPNIRRAHGVRADMVGLGLVSTQKFEPYELPVFLAPIVAPRARSNQRYVHLLTAQLPCQVPTRNTASSTGQHFNKTVACPPCWFAGESHLLP